MGLIRSFHVLGGGSLSAFKTLSLYRLVTIQGEKQAQKSPSSFTFIPPHLAGTFSKSFGLYGTISPSFFKTSWAGAPAPRKTSASGLPPHALTLSTTTGHPPGRTNVMSTSLP